jgi:heat shock protein HtpX
MTYAAVLAGSIALISQLIMQMMWFGGMGGGRDRDNGGGNIIALVAVILTAILAPLAATIIQLAISRKREYVADASGAELTRYPQGLASALKQISGNARPPVHEETAIAHMMIAPPLNLRGKTSTLFATHPPTEDRIARLTEMAGGIDHRHDKPVSRTYRTPFSGGAAGAAPESVEYA